MASDSALPPVIGAIADDRDGNALGTITTVFLDDVTERPTWVGFTDGLHAAPDDVPVIAPIEDAEFAEGRLRLTVSAAAVRTAPRVSQPDRLSPVEETTLRAHYLRTAASSDTAATTPGTAADTAMTRSEERLAVTTVVEPWTRAVLRIEQVTEEVMVPVTVTRQRAVVEHLPLAPGTRPDGDAVPGRVGAEQTSGWITLYSEQPVVSLQRVPVERARMVTSWVTDQQTLTEPVRHEEFALEDGTTTG